MDRHNPIYLEDVVYGVKHIYIVDGKEYSRFYEQHFCQLKGCSLDVRPKIVFDKGVRSAETANKHSKAKYCCPSHGKLAQYKRDEHRNTKLHVVLNSAERAIEKFTLNISGD